MTVAPAAGRQIDVCNGDADGLCAVLQWRLEKPAPALLVTGLKRDIALLDRVQAGPGDEVLVCDVSLQRNRAALLRLLAAGTRVRYFDHHAPPDVPDHPNLEIHIDLDSRTCTSLLMDCHLGGAHRSWALVGAYGDNLTGVADALAAQTGMTIQDRDQLRMLGEAINYNAYGEEESDVFMAPARLYETLLRYRCPLDLLQHESIAQQLDTLRRDDLHRAADVPPYRRNGRASATLLPDAGWSRRVIGCLANELARAEPERAHAVLKAMRGGAYVVSVRAPLSAAGGARELCRRFGGAGRAGAAGIDRLPAQDLDRFLEAFDATRWGASSGDALTDQAIGTP
ncbi:MAG: hypothetical protein Q7U63_09320 [Polaromonas sp.]|uniref:hypothetical protein n=1 Tax=Polaromonas sp. TaxID=1869339 RepID=UPI0027228B9F|nr:hypothetical protein [Polaromonas sp.]MDO9113983.1 hypothetical protein [Polaromonas sp.]MDP1886090.1 hypothetical protein [Polaromonas sp.]